MKKVIINENQKGLVFKNGKYVKTVGAGKYFLTGGKEVEINDVAHIVYSTRCPLEVLLEDENFASLVTVTEVNDEQFALTL